MKIRRNYLYSMLTCNQAFYAILSKLQPLYDAHEASAIAHELMQHITGLGKTQRLINKETSFTEPQQKQYDSLLAELLTGKPLQYVIGAAWFMGKPYKVNKHVLIPRPETEELVQWIMDDWKNKNDVAILDIGTGSGCIPISLKLALPLASITACDISNEALEVAKENASVLDAKIQFLQLDFLQQSAWEQFPQFDVIVSNPPYIPETEKDTLHKNVRDFEPGTALFVPGDDPLLFYKAIAQFGKEHLKTGGSIYCELHTDHALDTKQEFENMGYKNVELRKDIHGNWRMLKVSLGLFNGKPYYLPANLSLQMQ